MNATYTDIEDGSRIDIEVEVTDTEAIDCGGDRVHRFVVADRSGAEFTVLATADEVVPEEPTEGSEWRLSGLLGVDPLGSVEPVGSPARDEPECPACGGEIRRGTTVDLVGATLGQALEEFGIERTVGVVDADASLYRRSETETVVDDWTPKRRERSVAPPEFVCTDCSRQLEAHELAGPTAAVGGDACCAELAAPSAEAASPETMGLAAGGAKDVTNFRENVASGYTPQPEAIGDEGLFYDYYFETGERTETDALFAPRYAAGVSEHPLEETTERYLSVGLDSTLSVEAFDRPRLELVAVLDISGSMESAFDAYYYDEHGNRQAAEDGAATKLEAATESLCALTRQLRDDDRLGVVLYDHRAHVAKPLRDVATTDMPAIRRHIREIQAGGSTNLADGFEAAVDMLQGERDPGVERRVVFMTDMMPNTGTTGESALTDLFADAAQEGIHTTFVGMGLDANAELAEALSGIRGANHYFVHSAAEFERRLGEEFDYMVTPLVYDLSLELDAEGYELEAVHGSPSADGDSDRLVHVETLFPSAKEDGEARGGVVLVRLDRTEADADLNLVASWTERDGSEHTERVSVEMPEETGSYAHDGVHKAIALARYARELRAWAADVQGRADRATGVDDWMLADQRGQHERESVPLVVPDRHADRFERLRSYLREEMEQVGDESIEQELELLETLCEEAPTTPREVQNR